jgi:hypothetical protein
MVMDQIISMSGNYDAEAIATFNGGVFSTSGSIVLLGIVLPAGKPTARYWKAMRGRQ